MRSEKALAQIIEAGEIKPSDTILEIGPGAGALTEKLLERAGHVIAVEKDHELVGYLEKKFEREIKDGRLKLIEGDILNLSTNYFLLSTNYKLIANIPYNITGEIFRKFLQEEKIQPEQIVLLVQKEVAQRIIARDGKESILSVSVKVYGEPKYIDTVKRGSFTPTPNVDSAILLIENISRKRFQTSPPNPLSLIRRGGSEAEGEVNQLTEENFFKILKAGFAHKRKLLSSNLKPLIKNDVSVLFRQCNIPEKSRAEDLKLENWLCLVKEINRI